ncbi:MFS transporter [Zobellia galactanivorans]|uniref:MFS transporter n=1 Tax=Zobellia galactanivorans (strain DSM 12802 / CCUG 47099 / CIP 106680 / NCIMB 13871 / Dsij) TaxID=63186 RepID=UPI001C06D647|nr:MFS transporter [Zobellia galactanivorans]MBU3028406.1 MFS transporter [Zobellia galactanivorans]
MKGKQGVRWKILTMIFFATTINYIDRQIIGILKPFIADDLNWSEADYGYIVTAFQIAYAIGLLSMGKFIDKHGTRLGYVWAIVVWSIAGMAHAAARGVVSFAAARFVLGIGEAANFPAAVKGIAEWFPKKERAFAAGLFNSGSTVGAILAPIVVTWITLSFGWQWAFIITGALGLIWVFFWLNYYTTPEKHPKITPEELAYIHQDNEEKDNRPSLKWIELFKYKQTYAICTTRFISDWVWWFFLFWIPDFLSKTHGVNLKDVVLPLIVIYAVSSIGGIGGGWLSSNFIKNGKSVNYARKTTIFICALLVLPVMLVSQIANLWVAVVFISLAAAGHQGWASNIFTIVSDVYPKNAVGSMMGLSGFTGAIGGALSAAFVGVLLESTGSYFLIFMVASSVYMLNWLILRVFIKEIKPIGI